jgi:hypothetical protein
MYARLLAPVCLLSVGAIAEPSERALKGSDRIVVYLGAHEPDISRAVVRGMQQEAGDLMRPVGYQVHWLEQGEAREVQAAFLFVVGLKGPCHPSPGPSGRFQAAKARLAFTFVENGRILPFSDVDCSALREFLAPALARQPKSQRDLIYGRAMGRLLAHELYHLVGQTKDHAHAGVAQAELSARELTAEQFTFGEEALARLRHLPRDPALE